MPLISVVIPAHGVADYLDRCLDSVLGEPASWLEVIAGDDELAEGALAAVAAALTRLRPDLLVVDFENLYPDGTTSPSGGARYLTGPESGTLAGHPALVHLTMTAWSKVFHRD